VVEAWCHGVEHSLCLEIFRVHGFCFLVDTLKTLSSFPFYKLQREGSLPSMGISNSALLRGSPVFLKGTREYFKWS
jgi:hypothetical protein